MDHEDQIIDPFSSDALWRISQFTLHSLLPLEAFPWNEDLPEISSGLFKNPLDLFDQNGSKLHDLDIFGAGFLEPSLPPESTTDAASECQPEANSDTRDTDDELEDIWAFENWSLETDPQKSAKSWENYQDRSFREPSSAYFSESGAKGFDAALALRENDQMNGPGNARSIVRNDVFFQSLFRLGLGWSSMLFRYNERRQKFENILKHTRISGISLVTLDGLINEISLCGNNMQKVRAFVEKAPTKSVEASSLPAFSTAASVVIFTLERQLVKVSKHLTSLLQIKALFQRCGELVLVLANMVEAVEKARSEAHIISSILKLAAHYSQIYGHMEALFREIVFRVVGPWLTHVEFWVAFGQKHPHRSNKGKLLSQERLEYSSYLPDQMPSFVPPDQAQLIFESGRSLRLLTRSHPHHPLAGDRIPSLNLPSLRCASTWADLERIQAKAREYETRLRAEILKYNRKELLEEKKDSKVSDKVDREKFPDSFALFDIDDERNVTGLLANNSSFERDTLGSILGRSENPATEQAEESKMEFSPELTSSLYLSLAPLLSSQALLIDFSCLHLLFKEHKLRDHLTLQWRFQLLGDGYFTSRLSHSLFNPEMESGERKSGVVRSGVHTGLRLGSRDSWPPASSELRLVLIGILNECYGAEYADGTGNPEFDKEKELPGGLSFSIRELTEEEIVKCKNPNAIEALDFLRLQYKPSNVIESIITRRSLNKYDRLFKQLLRLLRMVSVVQGLVRDSTNRNSLSGDTRNILQKFRVDCQHFILAISDYCFHIGIGSTWQRFQETLSKIESSLDRGDVDGTIEAAHSIPRLRAYHEDTLDHMLFSVFLGKRHAEVAKLLDGIFDTILKFAPLSRMDGRIGVRHESETAINRLYAIFRKQTSAFVGYLRSLDGARVSSAKSRGRSGMAFATREAPTSIFDHLLVRLDMKRYY
ncbi:hypothetical protein ARAM_000642 [Aspergillus rambellii]|uniref:Spindle pole body component n=1 Tax=Aspergillus rambellii TaxID=308745 RepID=A0A0F8VD27_9EURO|nr:hypothetical protein ARAM_000642 [Aspergillus rambellii]